MLLLLYKKLKIYVEKVLYQSLEIIYFDLIILYYVYNSLETFFMFNEKKS